MKRWIIVLIVVLVGVGLVFMFCGENDVGDSGVEDCYADSRENCDKSCEVDLDCAASMDCSCYNVVDAGKLEYHSDGFVAEWFLCFEPVIGCECVDNMCEVLKNV